MIYGARVGLLVIMNWYFQPRPGGALEGSFSEFLKSWLLTKGKEPGQTDIKTEAYMHQITLGELPAHSRLILMENDGRIGQIQQNQ